MIKNSYQKLQKILGPLTGNGVQMAMIDSGWDYTIKCSYIQKGVGFVAPNDEHKVYYSEDFNDRIGHGTSCSYLFNQLAPETKITPIRIYGRQKKTSISILYHAIKWAIGQQFKLINISSGTSDVEAINPLYELCEDARKKGIIIVATMHHGNIQEFPAQFDNVISVGGFKDIKDHQVYYHRPGNTMEYATKSHDHHLLTLQGNYAKKSALSYTAPIISGFAALLLERFPKYSIDEIREVLTKYAYE